MVRILIKETELKETIVVLEGTKESLSIPVKTICVPGKYYLSVTIKLEMEEVK